MTVHLPSRSVEKLLQGSWHNSESPLERDEFEASPRESSEIRFGAFAEDPNTNSSRVVEVARLHVPHGLEHKCDE